MKVTDAQIDKAYKSKGRLLAARWQADEMVRKYEAELANRKAELYTTGQIDGKNEDTRNQQFRAAAADAIYELSKAQATLRKVDTQLAIAHNRIEGLKAVADHNERLQKQQTRFTINLRGANEDNRRTTPEGG
jgi:hypothetical protein